MIDFDDPKMIVESDLSIRKMYFHLRILKDKLEKALDYETKQYNNYINNKEHIEHDKANILNRLTELNAKKNFINKELENLKENKQRLESMINQYTPSRVGNKVIVNILFRLNGINKEQYLNSLEKELGLINYEINNDIKQIDDLNTLENNLKRQLENLENETINGLNANTRIQEIQSKLAQVNNYIKLVLETLSTSCD